MQTRKIDCPYCGANLNADIENRKVVYCTYCGKQLILEDNKSETNINQNININQNVNHHVTNDAEILREQNRHKERKTITVLISIIVLVALGGALYFNSKNNTTSIEVAKKQDTQISNDIQSTEAKVEEVNKENGTGVQTEVGINTQTIDSIQSEADNQKAEKSVVEKSQVKYDENTKLFSFSFLDHKQFKSYWINGKYRCPNDIPSGNYVMLSLFTPFPNYNISKDPNDFTWSKYTLYREYSLNDGEYVNVGHGAILVPQEEIDNNDIRKYGVFEVGIDLPAGDYKMVSDTDYYESEIVHAITGIKGGFQITKGSPAGELINSNMIFNESEYVSLNEGEFITIVNASLELVS